MILEETLLSNLISQYAVKMTAKEPTLLENLRQETLTQTNAPQMLSGPVVGQLLHLFVQILDAKHIIEVGTFTGYSALYMASALRDGKLITCEIDERHALIAKSYFDRSPHGHKIDLRIGPALKTLEHVSGPFDLAFIDADKKNYPNYYEKLLPKIRKGGMIIIDNALWSGRVLEPLDLESKAIASLNEKASQDSQVETLMLAIRDGLLICRKND
ncbi:MAG TPA: class I SAM-dependent methyltransferase [Gammaproteobacteria bacterium]|nr:class I SAM-dependent methyltransferase [Gammaproteobacteria bacterium]